jgi:predicted amidophosphoribosyltransferase
MFSIEFMVKNFFQLAVQAVVEPHVPKLLPGLLAVCRNCGSTGPDFARCDRCKKPLPSDVKRIADPNYRGHEAKVRVGL